MAGYSARVLKGAAAPEGFELQIGPGSSGLDMTDVVSASLAVMTQDGADSTWTASITSATETLLTLTHVFDEAGLEAARAGTVHMVAELTTAGGLYRSGPYHLHVEDWRSANG